SRRQLRAFDKLLHHKVFFFLLGASSLHLHHSSCMLGTNCSTCNLISCTRCSNTSSGFSSCTYGCSPPLKYLYICPASPATPILQTPQPSPPPTVQLISSSSSSSSISPSSSSPTSPSALPSSASSSSPTPPTSASSSQSSSIAQHPTSSISSSSR